MSVQYVWRLVNQLAIAHNGAIETAVDPTQETPSVATCFCWVKPLETRRRPEVRRFSRNIATFALIFPFLNRCTDFCQLPPHRHIVYRGS